MPNQGLQEMFGLISNEYAALLNRQKQTAKNKNSAIREIVSLEQQIRNSNIPNRNAYLKFIEEYKKTNGNLKKINENYNKYLTFYSRIKKEKQTGKRNNSLNTHLKNYAPNKYIKPTLTGMRSERLDTINSRISGNISTRRMRAQRNMSRITQINAPRHLDKIKSELAKIKSDLSSA